MGNSAIGIYFLLILGLRFAGIVVVVVALFLKLSTSRETPSNRRTSYIWGSIGLFALAVALDDWFLFSHQVGWWPAYVSIACLCATFILALLGEGPGRTLIAVTSLFIFIIRSIESLHILLR
jgi:hypothetical protein